MPAGHPSPPEPARTRPCVGPPRDWGEEPRRCSTNTSTTSQRRPTSAAITGQGAEAVVGGGRALGGEGRRHGFVLVWCWCSWARQAGAGMPGRVEREGRSWGTSRGADTGEGLKRVPCRPVRHRRGCSAAEPRTRTRAKAAYRLPHRLEPAEAPSSTPHRSGRHPLRPLTGRRCPRRRLGVPAAAPTTQTHARRDARAGTGASGSYSAAWWVGTAGSSAWVKVHKKSRKPSS